MIADGEVCDFGRTLKATASLRAGSNTVTGVVNFSMIAVVNLSVNEHIGIPGDNLDAGMPGHPPGYDRPGAFAHWSNADVPIRPDQILGPIRPTY